MSSLCLTGLKKFSNCLSYCSVISFEKMNCYRCCHFKRHLLKHRVMNYALSPFCTTNKSFAKPDIDSLSAEKDLDLREFNSAYELVRKAIFQVEDKALNDVANWKVKVADYNLQDGKKIRGQIVLKSFKALSEGELTSEKVLNACILGWCLEMLQGFFIIHDDIMDCSVTRRSKPCWYKRPDVGLIAINDGLLLESSIYQILEKYFRECKSYSKILHEFLQVTRQTVLGQCLDMLNSPPNKKPKFENFNLEKYRAVVEYKTSHYSFRIPVHLAMHLVGNFSDIEFESTKNICLKLGLMYQMQDDFLDIFGDPAITGKIGTDVSDGKCTWFSASFFECAPEDMRKVMIENYGINTEDSVSKVMEMFKELCLEEKFYECEQALMHEISIMIESLPRDSLRSLFHSLVKKVYQRKK